MPPNCAIAPRAAACMSSASSDTPPPRTRNGTTAILRSLGSTASAAPAVKTIAAMAAKLSARARAAGSGRTIRLRCAGELVHLAFELGERRARARFIRRALEECDLFEDGVH